MPEKKISKIKKAFGLKEKSSFWIGLLQGGVVFFYIALITLFISRAQALFGELNAITGPAMLLILLVLSILFLVLVVFAYPIIVFKEGDAKKAVNIVAFTFFWLLLIFILFLILLVFV